MNPFLLTSLNINRVLKGTFSVRTVHPVRQMILKYLQTVPHKLCTYFFKFFIYILNTRNGDITQFRKYLQVANFHNVRFHLLTRRSLCSRIWPKMSLHRYIWCHQLGQKNIRWGEKSSKIQRFVIFILVRRVENLVLK